MYILPLPEKQPVPGGSFVTHIGVAKVELSPTRVFVPSVVLGTMEDDAFVPNPIINYPPVVLEDATYDEMKDGAIDAKEHAELGTLVTVEDVLRVILRRFEA